MDNSYKLLTVDEKFLDFAANQNHQDALIILSCAYETGILGSKDFKQAYEYAERAANTGSVWAMYALAKFLINTLDDKKSMEDAFFWIDKASKLRFPPAEFLQAQFLESGKTGIIDLKKAEELYKRAAEGGLIEAASYLNHAYEQGLFGKPDIALSVKYAKDAANGGDMVAASYLADCYLKGKGIESNLTEALRWYELAAENGNRLASLSLAMIFAKGLHGAPIDKKKSQHYTELADRK